MFISPGSTTCSRASRRLWALLAVVSLCASASAAICISTARGAGPAAVTVRVEGLAETKLPPTAVTTITTGVVKDGNSEHSCPGTSDLGALQNATGGNWSGPWNSGFKQYEIFSIEGEEHAFEPGAKANYFWELWRNYRSSEKGACEAEAESGEKILFVVGCFGEACPPELTFGKIEVLGVEAPQSASVGEAVNVIVKRYKGTGEATPAAGASITGAGSSAVTDNGGHATLTPRTSGSQLLRVSAPGAVRTDAFLCVHNGADGTCGAAAPTAPIAGPAPPTTSAQPYSGPYAIVADVTGLHDGHRYARRHGPRVLTGTVSARVPIKDVELRLTRTVHTRTGRRRCSFYDGRVERLRAMTCGAAHGRFFSVGSAASFSYLLPFSLPRGRYVLDVEATDAAGNQTTLARGSSRVVFDVG